MRGFSSQGEKVTFSPVAVRSGQADVVHDSRHAVRKDGDAESIVGVQSTVVGVSEGSMEIAILATGIGSTKPIPGERQAAGVHLEHPESRQLRDQHLAAAV